MVKLGHRIVQCLTWIIHFAVRTLLTSYVVSKRNEEPQDFLLYYHFLSAYGWKSNILTLRDLTKSAVFVREIKNSVHSGGS